MEASKFLPWAVAVGYSGTMPSANSLAHGPELAAERRWPWARLDTTLSQQFPQTIARQESSIRLISSGIRVSASLAAAVASNLFASFGLGVGLDATHVAPSGPGAKPAFWVTDPLVRAAASLENAYGHLVVSLRAGVDLDLLAPRYLISRSDGAQVLWMPSRWRPFVSLRLGYAF